MKVNKYYAVQRLGDRADVYIYGDIVTPDEQFFEDETSAWSFKREIDDLDVSEIHVHINSYGGAVSEGWAIYNALREHPARIVTHADGFVASAAIYPFMAGEERIASNLSAFFFHQALAYPGYANADELRKAADDIEKINGQGLAAFTNAGIDADYILELEKAETWMGAAEALEAGIATAMVADMAPAMVQTAKRTIMQRVMRTPVSLQKPPKGPEGAQPAQEVKPTTEPATAPKEEPKSDPVNNKVLDLFKNF